jgi:hypothetical protein
MNFYSHKITTLQELRPGDSERRLEYCNLNDNRLLDISFFFDEALNYRIWSSENAHAFVETRLHPIKVGVWIAASRRCLIAFIVKIKEPVINEVT